MMDEPEVIISLYLIGLPIVVKCLPLLKALLCVKGQYTVYTAQHAVKKSSHSQDSVLFEADHPRGLPGAVVCINKRIFCVTAIDPFP